MYVPKSLGQVLGYNGSYDSGTCPHGWISRRAGSRDTGEVAPTGLYGLDDGFRLMLGILCCCLGQCYHGIETRVELNLYLAQGVLLHNSSRLTSERCVEMK